MKSSAEANDAETSRKNSASIEIEMNENFKKKPLSRIDKYHGDEGKR